MNDLEARRNKHGEYYDGYLLDLSLDADSELICGIDVLPANSDEAANAKKLIESEEAAHGNDIESLSIDAICITYCELIQMSLAESDILLNCSDKVSLLLSRKRDSKHHKAVL